MKIGLVVPGFSANADDWCIPALRNLVRELARDHDVRVVTLRYPYQSRAYDIFGARVIALGGGQRRGVGSVALWEATLFRLASEQRREPFDVLHAFWATESGFLTALAGRFLDVPTVVSLAGGELVGFPDLGYGDQLRRVQRCQVAAALRLADVVTAGSSYLVDLARSRFRSFPVDRLVRAPLGVDANLFRPGPSSFHDGPPRLVHVGSLVPVKDQATLLAALARLHARGIRSCLDVAGSGPGKPALTALASKLGIDRFVRFHDDVPQDRLPELYRQGDLFVLSSRHEAQCLAVLEAAACGLPIAGTAVGVVPELSPDAALAVAPGNADALAVGIGALLADPARRQLMGEAARQRVERDYDVRCCTARFSEIYEQARLL